MAALAADPIRRRLLLSSTALAAGVLVLPGRLPPDRLSGAVAAELSELEEIGAVEDGELVPWVAQMLILMLAPDLHVEAVVATAVGESTFQVWARPEAAVTAQIDARGWVDLAPTEPSLLAWTLADAIALAAAPGPDGPPRRPIDAARLASFEEALADGDHGRAGGVVGDGRGLSADELTVMAALASPHRRTWRITTTWMSPTGPARRSLSIIATGRGGLWRVDPPGPEPGAAGARQLVPVSPAEVWQHLRSILPPGTSSSPDDPVHPGRAPCPMRVPPTPTASCDSWPPPATSTQS